MTIHEYTYASNHAIDKISLFLKDLQKASPLIHPSQLKGIEQLNKKKGNLTYHEFTEKIPTVTKNDIFGDKNYLNKMFESSSQLPIKIVPAAGTSLELLSFRIHNNKNETLQFALLSQLISNKWNINLEKVLFLNAYPTGISLPDSLNSVECGAKPEVLALALNTFRNQFEAFILICQPKFLRYAITHQFLKKDDIKNLNIIIGGSWHPHSFGYFLSKQLDVSTSMLEQKMISLFGVAELGLGIGIQTPHLSNARINLFDSIKNKQQKARPMIFLLDSNRFFLESINGRLIITSLNPKASIPLIRYHTGDFGEIIPKNLTSKIETYTSNNIYFTVENRRPNESELYPILEDEVEEVLCLNPDLYKLLTGNFLIKKNAVIFELSELGKSSQDLELQIQNILKVDCPISLVSHLKYKNHFHTDLLRKPRVYE